jgi:hypothetical protein
MAQESATDLERLLAQAERELSEAREQQAATSQVLRVISSSRGELQPVFQAMLENATRICEAKFGTLTLFEGELTSRIRDESNVPKRIPFLPAITAFHAAPAQRFQTRRVGDDGSE